MNSFDMLNALVSLCDKRSDGQDALYQLGYKTRDIRLEYPTGISGKGVVVDLLLISEAINSVLCIESKSGRNVELAQARGYGKLKPQQFAALISKWREPSAFSVDVGYVCTAVQLERISKGLKRENLNPSIICFHELEDGQLPAAVERYPHLRLPLERMTRPCLITLERNKLKNQRLASRLSRGIALDLATMPSFINFDVSSSAAHLTRCLMQAMVGFAATGRATFSSEELASAAYGTEAWLKTMRRAELLARVNETLAAAADAPSLGRYLARDPIPTRAPLFQWRISAELVGVEANALSVKGFVIAAEKFAAELGADSK